MQGLVLLTDATVEPITVSDAKAFLRIDPSDTNDDTLVTALISAARRHAENYTNRALISQTWDYWIDGFPPGTRAPGGWWDGVREGALSSLIQAQGEIRIPKPPLLAINSITYYDTTDSPQLTDLTTLVIQPEISPAVVFPKIGQIWPVTTRPRQAVQINFTAGYGTTAGSVPADIVHAIKILIVHFYENRGVMVESRLAEMPFSVRALLDPYKVYRLS